MNIELNRLVNYFNKLVFQEEHAVSCLLVLCVFVSSCNASDNTTEASQPSSTGSFLPIPISEEFFSDSTVMVEVLVFDKVEFGQSALVDQLQIERNTIDENTELALLQINRDATRPNGIVASDGITELSEFRQCEGELEVQEFNFVARSTDGSGANISIVNTDFCGSVPGFNFDDIDGQVDINQITTLIFSARNT